MAFHWDDWFLIHWASPAVSCGLAGAAGLGWAAAGSAETPHPWELCGSVPVLGAQGLGLDACNWFPSPDVWEDHFHQALGTLSHQHPFVFEWW